MKPAKILYFVDGVAPTPEDYQAAAALSAQVSFRNARAVPAEGSLEKCDGVAGCVPASYANLPTAEEAIEAHTAKLAALSAKVGDTPAPKKAAAKKQQKETPVETKPADAPVKAAPPVWTPNAE